MTSQQRLFDHPATSWIPWSKFAGPLAVGLLLVFGSASPALSSGTWTGEGSDRLWTTPENWSSGQVPTSGAVYINGPEAQGRKGPVIEDGIEAVAGDLRSDDGQATMTITGGSLELNGFGAFWADASGSRATMEMSGGVVDFTGSPGILQLGWQSRIDPARSSVGTWEMTGGEVNVKGVNMPADDQGGVGRINLWGGTFTVGTARGGLNMYQGAQIDITEGTLVLANDKTSQVESYIESGWITAYDGDGELSVLFAGGVTTVTAVDPAMPGDYNGNGELDTGDLDLQSQAIKDQDLAFDLNSDRSVDFKDREEWVHELKGTWIGDSNLDGEFGSRDFVIVLTAGKYERAEKAGWAEGDWDGDQLFDSGDFVAALRDGGYEQGARPAVSAVPEPSSVLLISMALFGFLTSRRRA